MKKNDKLIVLIGVILLIFSSVGIYTWSPIDSSAQPSDIDDFFSVSASFKALPDAVVVSACSPFLALIATPLAVHYDSMGNQTIIPLYIQINNPCLSV